MEKMRLQSFAQNKRGFVIAVLLISFIVIGGSFSVAKEGLIKTKKLADRNKEEELIKQEEQLDNKTESQPVLENKSVDSTNSPQAERDVTDRSQAEVRAKNPIPETAKKQVVNSKAPKPTTTNNKNLAKPAAQPKPQVSKVPPTPKPSTSASNPAPSGFSNEKIASLLNAERTKSGLSVLRLNSVLSNAAFAKSKDMAVKKYFAHVGPDGNNDFVFVKNAGYKYSAVGSNIAMGDFNSAEELVRAWMDSPGHKKNILADFGVDLGVGVYNDYFTMFVARPL